jgi:hypothetical protein
VDQFQVGCGGTAAPSVFLRETSVLACIFGSVLSQHCKNIIKQARKTWIHGRHCTILIKHFVQCY